MNTRFLLPNRLEGIGWYTCETLRRITSQHPEHEFYFFFDRPFDPRFIFSSNITPKILFPPARHPFLWYAWFEWSVPQALAQLKPDVFLSTDGYCSLRAHCPQVMVIHDIAFEHFPDHVGRLTSWYYRHFTPKYAQKATRLATVSHFTKNDVINRYGIAAEKIDVTWNGANEIFHPLSAGERQQAKLDFAGGKEYFVYAGALHPRKNIIHLLLAFEAFKKNSASDLQLVLAGRNWNYREAMQVIAQSAFKEEIHLTGHLDQSELSRVVGGALALVYVSLFEGFGIPIIEAMNCEVPVITSNVSSMPEVAGPAALVADPANISEIAAQMERLAEKGELRQELIEKGKVQRRQFSWQQTADRLWQCIIKSLNEKQ